MFRRNPVQRILTTFFRIDCMLLANLLYVFSLCLSSLLTFQEYTEELRDIVAGKSKKSVHASGGGVADGNITLINQRHVGDDLPVILKIQDEWTKFYFKRRFWYHSFWFDPMGNFLVLGTSPHLLTLTLFFPFSFLKKASWIHNQKSILSRIQTCNIHLVYIVHVISELLWGFFCYLDSYLL